MNLEERMKMIDNKLVADEIKRKKEKEEEERRTKECKDKIHSLRNRISDLLEFAWYAENNGISLSNSGWGGHEGYDTGMFFSNSWSHVVGIMDESHLGIRKGGAFGYIDFYTNGDEIYGYDTKNKRVVDPLLYDMEVFIRYFDELESNLYQYVENKCK